MDKNTLQFINKFQVLEKLIKKLSKSHDSTRFSDSLKKLANDNHFIQNKSNFIEDLYALRNVFSHNERGKYIANINNFIFKEIDQIILTLQDPPIVKSIFEVNVYQANEGDSILNVMKVMKKKTYTQIPIMRDEKFVGVFSYSSFFEWLVDQDDADKKDISFINKVFKDINSKYLNSPCVNYLFISETTSIYEIPPLFERAVKKQERLDCLLITPRGLRGERITGIVTSWDIGLIK